MTVREASVRVNESPSRIWSIIADPPSYESFFRLANGLRAEHAVLEMGSEFEMTLKPGIPIRLRVVESRQGRRLTSRAYYGMRFQMDWTLEPLDSDTRVGLRVDYVSPYSLHGEVLPEAKVASLVGDELSASLQALKSRAESRRAVA